MYTKIEQYFQPNNKHVLYPCSVAVDPVVQGKTRADQFYSNDKEVGCVFVSTCTCTCLFHCRTKCG